MSSTTQEVLAGSGTQNGPAGRRGWPRLRRIGRHAATWSILSAALLSTAVSTGAAAAAPAPRPQQAGQQRAPHYYYVTAFDSGLHSGVGPNSVHVDFYAQTDRLTNQSDHSLTEIFTRDAAGNAVEVGITTDTFWLPNAKPHLFVSSWTNGKWNGYGSNAGFVSTTSAAKPGVTQPPLNKYTEYGYTYRAGKMWVTYNNAYIGYFPANIWPGGWRTATESQTYAEVYSATSGALPTMNGAVRNYSSSTGSHFTAFTASSPYVIHNASPTGFGFSGGNG
jgi:Neprosin